MPEISGSGGPGASSKLTPVPNPSPVIHSHQHGPGGQNPEGWHSACRRQRTACSARSLSTIMDEILARSLKQKEVIRSEVDAFVPVAPRIPPEARRKEFIAYLHNSGFLKAITTMIITLYEEEELPVPERAIEYIAASLGYSLTVPMDYDQDHQRIVDLQERVVEARMANDSLLRQLDDFETTDSPVETVDVPKLPPFKLQKGAAVGLID